MSEHPTHRLSDYLDGGLPPSRAAEVERHLADCEECARVLDDLRAVVERARSLEDRSAPRDLWPEIAARIGAPSGEERTAGSVDGAGTIPGTGRRRAAGDGRAAEGGAAPVEPAPRPGRGRRTHRRVVLSLPQLAAAAAALLLLGGGGVWLWTDGGAGDPVAADRPARVAGGSAPGEDAPLLVGATEAPAGGPSSPTLARYGAAIAELERTLFENGGDLDTATVRRLRESLEKVDRAIAEAREALLDDPGSAYLHRHLAETMQQKVRVLRRTADLVAAET